MASAAAMKFSCWGKRRNMRAMMRKTLLRDAREMMSTSRTEFDQHTDKRWTSKKRVKDGISRLEIWASSFAQQDWSRVQGNQTGRWHSHTLGHSNRSFQWPGWILVFHSTRSFALVVLLVRYQSEVCTPHAHTLNRITTRNSSGVVPWPSPRHPRGRAQRRQCRCGNAGVEWPRDGTRVGARARVCALDRGRTQARG